MESMRKGRLKTDTMLELAIPPNVTSSTRLCWIFTALAA